MLTRNSLKSWLSFCLIGGTAISTLITHKAVQAQITSDGTLSTTINTANYLDFLITDGQQVGGNLFHSFRQFSVPNGGSVTFDNGLNIQNIFSRVTGNSLSEINGLITTQGSANFFLLNPNGITFGANAQLNVGGSFIATTASQIEFADGSIFDARNPQVQPLLTVSQPVGLRFRETAADIVNRSVVNQDQLTPGLEVLSHQTLALVGGNVLLEGGGLITFGGRIELGSVAAPAYISLIPIDTGWALDYEGVQDFQDIRLSQNSLVQTVLFDEGSGEIVLQGRQVILSEGAQISGFTLSEFSGGKISIKATDLVEIREDSDLSTTTFSTGASGDIFIEAQRLAILDDGSSIDSATDGEGRGGNITINSTKSLEIAGKGGFTRLTAQTFAEGNAGIIKITTGRLSLRNGGVISSSTTNQGNGGQIIINASESIEISGQGILGGLGIREDEVIQSGVFARTRAFLGKNDEAVGDGGSININTARLGVQNGGGISVSSFLGSQGNAGDLSINASESIFLTGNESIISATSEQTLAGNLNLNTPLLVIQDGAALSSATQSGQAGNVTINAADGIHLRGHGRLSVEATDGGTAGNLTLNTNQLTVFEGARITVSSLDGLAGNININAHTLTLNRGAITAETGISEGEEGANIVLNLSNIVQMENESLISATANGLADGGNIQIDTPFLVVFPPTGANGSDIIAKAQQGDGGGIFINAQGIFGIEEGVAIEGNQTNDIDASSEFGASGEIILNEELDPNRAIEQLPETVIDPNQLIAQNACKRGEESEFVMTGRGGLPTSLNENLDSEATQIELIEPASPSDNSKFKIQNSESSTNSAIPTQGWIFNEKGEVILVAYQPTIDNSQRLQPTRKGCF